MPSAWSALYFVMLGVLPGRLRLNRRSQWRHTPCARYYRRFLRKARSHLDAIVIGKTGLDSEACDPIVVDGIHEVAVVLPTYRGGGYGERTGAPVHLQ